MSNRTDEVVDYFVTGADWNDYERYFSIAVLTIFDALAILFNSLVIMIIMKDRELREKPDSLLIANLALSDLLVSTTIIPFSIDTLIHKKLRFSQTTAVFIGFANFTFCIASILTLMVLVIDQTLTIKWPFRYGDRRTPKGALYAIIYTWVHSISCALPPMFGLSSYSCFIINTGTCTNYQWAGTKKAVWFTLIVTLSSWGLALVVTVVCYFQIGYIAVKQKSKMTQDHFRLSQLMKQRRGSYSLSSTSPSTPVSPPATITPDISSSRSPQKHKIKYGNFLTPDFSKKNKIQDELSHISRDTSTSTRPALKRDKNSTSVTSFRRYSVILKPAMTLLLIIITYFCTWSPFCILLLVELAERSKAYPVMSLVFLWIGHCSSLLNPLIYFLRYKRFRNALCRHKRRIKKAHLTKVTKWSKGSFHERQTGSIY